MSPLAFYLYFISPPLLLAAAYTVWLTWDEKFEETPAEASPRAPSPYTIISLIFLAGFFTALIVTHENRRS
jgi:hypothetical protein